jgi:hypothetical protein
VAVTQAASGRMRMRERGVEAAACCDWTLAFTRLTQ